MDIWNVKVKSVNDWVSSCRRLVVEGARGQGGSRKTWEGCVKDDIWNCSVCIPSGLFLGMCGGT